MSDIPAFPYEILWGERSHPVGRKPDPQRRRGVPRARAAGAGGYRGRGVPARAGERGSFEAALRQRPRITRPRPIARPVDVINRRPGRIRPRRPRRAPTGLLRAVPSAPGRASRRRSRGRAGRRNRSMAGSPPCSPQIPEPQLGMDVARPRSTAIRISSPTPAVVERLERIVLGGCGPRGSGRGSVPSASSREKPSAVWVRSFVPKEKKSASLGDLVGPDAGPRQLDHRPAEILEPSLLARPCASVSSRSRFSSSAKPTSGCMISTCGCDAGALLDRLRGPHDRP